MFALFAGFAVRAKSSQVEAAQFLSDMAFRALWAQGTEAPLVVGTERSAIG